MLAAVRDAYGPPEIIRLREYPLPEPGDTELLVRVHAATVNRTDCANLTGRPLVMHLVLGVGKPRSARIGTDFAGKVVSVGRAVTKFRAGDRVCGFRDTGLGGQAQYLTISEDGPLMTIPSELSYATAAAGLEGAHYAYSFIRRLGLRMGKRVLINGATGAIGSAALQFAATFDVDITATARGADAEKVSALGAHRIIDYTQADFTRSTQRYDYVVDAVGKSTYGASKRVLKDGGIYLSSELGPYAQNVFLALYTPLRAGNKVLFPVPYPPRESFPFIRRHLEEGSFRPLIDRSFALADIAAAYRYVLTGQKRGNVVLRTDA